MKKFIAPIVLFLLAAGVVAYLFLDFSVAKSSFDADSYLTARSKIDSLEIALWQASGSPDQQLKIRGELDSSWSALTELRNSQQGDSAAVAGESALGLSSDVLAWVAGGAVAVVLCVILLVALGHRKKVLTQKMEALKAESRFKEPKNGFENDPTLAPRPRPQRHSITDEVVGENSAPQEQKIEFEDENGIPENKILSMDADQRPPLRPTAKERITSAMQSLSDVLRTPRGLSRDHTMKLRAQSHNVTGDPSLQASHPLKTSRFDREFTEKNKILQMSRRGFPASAIASQLKIPQEQVESVIKEALESGN